MASDKVRIFVKMTPEEKSKIRERMSEAGFKNLNQYAKRANETGSIYITDIKELQGNQKEILEAVGDILERLSTL